eukprot:CAMPEP_0114542340 /NCGR_PEP_ID=MMETSP0114-20121206/1787_1 /TAXON_ID=31324 /ORGANISM="Goniomonas sp, Strain m" /LENGTH=55 /DNA_ID=CAMNT_0001726639 /DNA_START=244 /DNA_END=411 /DNA_ORIENTATION=+
MERSLALLRAEFEDSATRRNKQPNHSHIFSAAKNGGVQRSHAMGFLECCIGSGVV